MSRPLWSRSEAPDCTGWYFYAPPFSTLLLIDLLKSWFFFLSEKCTQRQSEYSTNSIVNNNITKRIISQIHRVEYMLTLFFFFWGSVGGSGLRFLTIPQLPLLGNAFVAIVIVLSVINASYISVSFQLSSCYPPNLLKPSRTLT